MTDLTARISFPASMLADPARETIVMSLMDGCAYTSKELAFRARITPATASYHLKKLVDAQILVCHNQGRHSYYRINGTDVASAIEALVRIAPSPTGSAGTKRKEGEFLYARRCYDHLAGRLGVAVADRVERLELIASTGLEYELTNKGNAFFQGLGCDLDGLRNKKRTFLRPCIDCTERRAHIAGSLGAALLDHFVDDDWVQPSDLPRVLKVTRRGQQLFYDVFGVSRNLLPKI